ncbi:MAG: hypothetical protein M0R33_17415 [Methylomonas sp.]|uniref:hypothetical protein n=1 Tax=Methylomonas sp. TaxID=418 RepID=UPI0025EC233C|nr:hypothetical protein [Methylomonas sp.]MCK9608227.1 hypothetical protein [Methylomonas sp.]
MEMYQESTKQWFIFNSRLRVEARSSGLFLAQVWPNYYHEKSPLILPAKITLKKEYKATGPYFRFHCLTPDQMHKLFSDGHFCREDKDIGVMWQNEGYQRATDGAYTRDIRTITATCKNSGITLEIRLEGNLSPVLPESPPIMLSGSDKQPTSYQFDFALPIESIDDFMSNTK